MAYREDRLPRVAETWQTLAALPHAVIIHTVTGRVMLVLLSARYAMRTWPATVVTKPSAATASGDASTDNDNRRWVFNKAARWEWMSVWDINEWLYQPTKWCTLTDCQDIAPPETFGYLGCRATGETVLLLAEALVTAGRRGLTVDSRSKFVKAAFEDSEGAHTVLDLLQKVLDGYPKEVQDEYRQRWEDAEKARQEARRKRALRCKAKLDGGGGGGNGG